MPTNDEVPGSLEWSLFCRIVTNLLPADHVWTPDDGNERIAEAKRGFEARVLDTRLSYHGDVVGKLMTLPSRRRYVRFNSGLRTPDIGHIMNMRSGYVGVPRDADCKSEARPFFSRRFEGLSSSKQVGILLTAYRIERLSIARFSLWPTLYPEKTLDERVVENVRIEKEILRTAEERYDFRWDEDVFLPNGNFPIADQSILDKHLEPGEADRQVEAFNS